MLPNSCLENQSLHAEFARLRLERLEDGAADPFAASGRNDVHSFQFRSGWIETPHRAAAHRNGIAIGDKKCCHFVGGETKMRGALFRILLRQLRIQRGDESLRSRGEEVFPAQLDHQNNFKTITFATKPFCALRPTVLPTSRRSSVP